MPEAPTPSPEGGDSNQPQDQWEVRYTGLQKVVAKRDADLTAANEAYATLQAQHAAAAAELETFRQRDAAANEEANARQTYDQLRARFEKAPPVPAGSNPQRTPASWVDADAVASFGQRPRTGTDSGWPIG